MKRGAQRKCHLNLENKKELAVGWGCYEEGTANAKAVRWGRAYCF